MNQVAGEPAEGDVSLPPNPEQLMLALRQIGYSFEQAISDLVDNCINAEARRVLIRFEYDQKSIRKVLVVDDGRGMTPRRLTEAMRFGAHEDGQEHSLGKFGMGLKLASFSHAKTLSVYTRAGGTASGRRWTAEGVGRNWICHGIPEDDVQGVMAAPYLDLDLRRCGTVIEWDRIDRLVPGRNGTRATIDNLTSRLRVHLGLHFHRFIERGTLSVRVDAHEVGQPAPDQATRIVALNPFGYDRAGDSNFPQTFDVRIAGVGAVHANAHIWPPNSKSPEYKLGNRAASRQGFYFYRNDRLIQAGGWNGVVESETEPHTSLARVAIDLPQTLDDHFGLNVQKSGVNVPAGFVDAVQGSESMTGLSFPKFRQRAAAVYRQKDERVQKEYPFVPGGSIPAELARRAQELIGGGGKTREVEIVWDDLDDGRIFDIDTSDGRTLRIDRRVRRKLLGGRKGTATDLPVFKTLIFLLVEAEFDKARLSAQGRRRVELLNELISLALRHEA